MTPTCTRSLYTTHQRRNGIPNKKADSDLNNLRTRQAVGVFNPRAAILFLATGTGLYFYFRYEKARIQAERAKAQEEASKKIGKARVGGPFSLIDQKGRQYTQEMSKGKFSLFYFGFTNCPDICPEELDKMGGVVDVIEKKYGQGTITPIFISCDPARDTKPAMQAYVADFHPRLIGLTGSYEEIKAACRAYRVYFSTPKDVSASDDYLVDHSIYLYLMDPEGEFVEAFGRAITKDTMAQRVLKEMDAWQKRHAGASMGL